MKEVTGLFIAALLAKCKNGHEPDKDKPT